MRLFSIFRSGNSCKDLTINLSPLRYLNSVTNGRETTRISIWFYDKGSLSMPTFRGMALKTFYLIDWCIIGEHMSKSGRFKVGVLSQRWQSDCYTENFSRQPFGCENPIPTVIVLLHNSVTCINQKLSLPLIREYSYHHYDPKGI